MTEPGGHLDVDGHMTASMIVHGHDEDADAPCHFFMLKATVHGEELVIGVAQEASAARILREQLDKYIFECDNDLDSVLKGFLEGENG